MPTAGPASNVAVSWTPADPVMPAGTLKYSRYRLTAPGYPTTRVIRADCSFTSTAIGAFTGSCGEAGKGCPGSGASAQVQSPPTPGALPPLVEEPVPFVQFGMRDTGTMAELVANFVTSAVSSL
jgi:hypothetical protein